MSENRFTITIEDDKGRKQTIKTNSFINFAPTDDDRVATLICLKGDIPNILRFYRALKETEKILNKECPFLEYLNENSTCEKYMKSSDDFFDLENGEVIE